MGVALMDRASDESVPHGAPLCYRRAGEGVSGPPPDPIFRRPRSYPFRLLAGVDDFTRECLAHVAETSFM